MPGAVDAVAILVRDPIGTDPAAGWLRIKKNVAWVLSLLDVQKKWGFASRHSANGPIVPDDCSLVGTGSSYPTQVLGGDPVGGNLIVLDNDGTSQVVYW